MRGFSFLLVLFSDLAGPRNAALNVFFYGLFMDVQALADGGVKVTDPVVAFADGLELIIGERASLVCREGSRTYGLLVKMTPEDVVALYSDSSVSDYIPETIKVTVPDGRLRDAECYLLPPGKLAGTNPDYARKLHALCRELKFPDSYLEHVRKAG